MHAEELLPKDAGHNDLLHDEKLPTRWKDIYTAAYVLILEACLKSLEIQIVFGGHPNTQQETHAASHHALATTTPTVLHSPLPAVMLSRCLSRRGPAKHTMEGPENPIFRILILIQIFLGIWLPAPSHLPNSNAITAGLRWRV